MLNQIWFKVLVFFNGSVFVGENEGFLKNGSQPVLIVESKGHALHAFVNQELQGHDLFLLVFIYYMSSLFHLNIFLIRKKLLICNKFAFGT